MSKEKGFIKLYRSLFDNPLWASEKFTRAQAWIDLLMLANHTETFFYKRDIKINVIRGQLARSTVELGDRWKWSRTKVQKFLNDLEKEQQIKQQKTNVTTLIFIVNYEKYQQKEAAKDTAEEQQESSSGAAEKQQRDTYKELKNVKNEKECKETISSDYGFTEFWKEYPKKDGKKACLAKWKSRNLNLMADELIADVKNRKSNCSKWKNGYAPNPLTYINGDRWEDEIHLGDLINEEGRRIDNSAPGRVREANRKRAIARGEEPDPFPF